MKKDIIDELKNVIARSNTNHNLIAQLTEAYEALDNPSNDDSTKQAMIDNCMANVSKILETDLAGTPDEMVIGGFVKSMQTINEKIKEQQDVLKKYDESDQIAKEQVENIKNLGSKIDELAETNLKSAWLTGEYEVEKITQAIEKSINLIKFCRRNDESQQEFNNLLERFESIKEKPALATILLPEKTNQPLTENQLNIEKTTNVRFINRKLDVNQTTLNQPEYIFALQLSLIEKIINIATRIKCLPEQNQPLNYLVNFANQEYYDVGDVDFIKGLDQFSQNYIKKTNKQYLNQPNKVNTHFLELASAIAITYSNFKKLNKVCLFIKEQITTKYAHVIHEITKNHPGIKSSHNNKISQFKVNTIIDKPKEAIIDTASLSTTKRQETNIITPATVDNNITSPTLQDDYGFEKNLDLLIFCLDKITKEINKLMQTKLISTVNYAWQHKELPDDFLACSFFIRVCHDFVIELIDKIEQHQEFNGWR